jgi:hypothetical protein
MVRAEFIDKLKLQSSYTCAEKIQIIKIVENVSSLGCSKSGVAIYHKDVMEQALGYLSIQSSLNEKFDSTEDSIAMENSISSYRIKKTNNLLSSRTSLLCKRHIVDDYLETYLTEYAAKVRKELKTQIELEQNP